MKPKVSVIIAVFNVEKYLTRCLESVINQSLHDIEIILVSNGPKSCDEICARYASMDNRIQHFMNCGSYSDSLNKGLSIAQGEYIGFVDADDWITPDMFETLYTAATNCDADICKSPFQCCFENESQNYYLYSDIPQGLFQLSSNPSMLSYQPSIWSGIYKKKFLQEISLHFLPGKFSYTDSPFQLEAFLRAQRIFFVSKPLYFYNMSNPNQTVKSSKRVLDGIIADSYLLQRMDIKALPQNIYEGLMLAFLRHAAWHLGRLNTFTDKKIFWHHAHIFFKKAYCKSISRTSLSLARRCFLLALTTCRYYAVAAALQAAATLIRKIFRAMTS